MNQPTITSLNEGVKNFTPGIEVVAHKASSVSTQQHVCLSKMRNPREANASYSMTQFKCVCRSHLLCAVRITEPGESKVHTKCPKLLKSELAVIIRNILSTAASLITCLHSVASRAKDLDIKPRVVSQDNVQ